MSAEDHPTLHYDLQGEAAAATTAACPSESTTTASTTTTTTSTLDVATPTSSNISQAMTAPSLQSSSSPPPQDLGILDVIKAWVVGEIYRVLFGLASFLDLSARYYAFLWSAQWDMKSPCLAETSTTPLYFELVGSYCEGSDWVVLFIMANLLFWIPRAIRRYVLGELDEEEEEEEEDHSTPFQRWMERLKAKWTPWALQVLTCWGTVSVLSQQYPAGLLSSRVTPEAKFFYLFYTACQLSSLMSRHLKKAEDWEADLERIGSTSTPRMYMAYKISIPLVFMSLALLGYPHIGGLVILCFEGQGAFGPLHEMYEEWRLMQEEFSKTRGRQFKHSCLFHISRIEDDDHDHDEDNETSDSVSQLPDIGSPVTLSVGSGRGNGVLQKMSRSMPGSSRSIRRLFGGGGHDTGTESGREMKRSTSLGTSSSPSLVSSSPRIGRRSKVHVSVVVTPNPRNADDASSVRSTATVGSRDGDYGGEYSPSSSGRKVSLW